MPEQYEITRVSPELPPTLNLSAELGGKQFAWAYFITGLTRQL